MKVRNTFIIFLVSGFWHGANWTFIVWGGLNALYFLPLLLLKRNRTNLGVVAEGRMLPTLKELWQMGMTFLLTVLAWVFFRVGNLQSGINFILHMSSIKGSGLSIQSNKEKSDLLHLFLVLCFFLIFEWMSRLDGKIPFQKYPTIVRNLFYVVVIILILYLGVSESEFIYFAF